MELKPPPGVSNEDGMKIGLLHPRAQVVVGFVATPNVQEAQRAVCELRAPTKVQILTFP